MRSVAFIVTPRWATVRYRQVLAEKILERKGKEKTMSKLNSAGIFIGLIIVVALATIAVTALLTNVIERKHEAKNAYVRVVEVTEDTTDPAEWGKNWPKQYDSYKRTALPTKTKYGGHGGNEALPEQKIERSEYHWLKRMFKGYAFSIDYRDRRGHAYICSPIRRKPNVITYPSGVPACTVTLRLCRSTESLATVMPLPV